LALAGKEAQALHHSYVGTEHLLLGLLREGEGVAARVLKSLEVDPARTRNEILKELDPSFAPPESEAESPQEGDKKDVKTPALRAFGRDLTELAKRSAGTGKSILAGTFAEAACLRKERTFYVSFDENPSEVVRDLSSVGIRLGPHLKSGVLRMHSARAETFSAEVHLMNIKRIVREHQSRCMVVDPLSAIAKAGAALTAGRVAERLICLAKSEGITLLSTSLLQGAQPLTEETPVQISTIADTWIHLTNISQAGERNRALSIVKSRGMKHSNQVRELILSDEGIAMADVYTAAGDVLMGTARWQKEAAEKTEQERILAEVEHKRSEVALVRAELTARIEALEQELKQKEAEAERLNGADARRKLDLAKRRKELEHSPSAKIFKKRPENSQGAGKRTPGRRSPKAGGQ
jgi:KaiC/GvpD/RAD55 family RecA-like ATPase